MALLGSDSNPSSKIARLFEALEEDPGVRIPLRVVRTKPRQVQRRLSPSEVDHLLTAYEGGVSVKRLAELYGIHRTTVLDHLKRAGVTTRPNKRKLTDDQVQEAAKLYESGLSLKAVGQWFGVDAQTVRKELMKAGVTIRPRN